MIKIRKAVTLSKLEIELQDILCNIKRHEGIINSIKIEHKNVKKFSKTTLKKLIEERKRLTDLITETIFLDD
jgi:hypothetical protein